MVFAGMQKLSLLDYPGVVACTLFTLGCNFRCPWCHNAGLVLPDQFPEGTLDADEVLSFLKKIKVVEGGLADMVAMDIKNGPSHYGETIGLKGAVPAAVEKSKDYLLSGPVEYEFRTTVVRGFHTEESLLEAADWIQGAWVWYLQQFQDSGALIQGEGLSAFSKEEMQHLLTILQKKLPAVKLRGI